MAGGIGERERTTETRGVAPLVSTISRGFETWLSLRHHTNSLSHALTRPQQPCHLWGPLRSDRNDRAVK